MLFLLSSPTVELPHLQPTSTQKTFRVEHTVFTIVANGGFYELLSDELGGDVHQWSRLGPRPHRHLPPAERGNPCEHVEDE